MNNISSFGFKMYSDLEDLLDKIRQVVIEKNGWIERKEICEKLNLPMNTQLVEGAHNSKIGQILYHYLRKENFGYKKVQLDTEDKFQYEIWICPPSEDIATNENLERTLKNIHEQYFIVESKQRGGKNQASVKAEPEIDLEFEDNENLKKITELINNGENIFITGYAGTGKSYILNKLKKRYKIDVTSTTGLAAVNIQGQTIHSWAGVGICNKPIEDVIDKILKRSKLRKQITECKILAIDEISMLDAKTFDYIDKVLRIMREEESLPFGGIQVLLFGDFFQLPPVQKDNGFCFESNCWNELNLKTVFLEKIYRQQDENFINSLNNLRLNRLTEDDLRLFYDREVNYDTYGSDILHIFSTNKEADNYNMFKFKSVESELYLFNSVDKIHRKRSEIVFNKDNPDERLTKFDMITLDAFDKSCKAPSELALKVGCRVMLLKNINFNNGLINGACGSILEVKLGEEESILVKFDNGVEANIPKQIFEAYRDGEVIVSREQYPLRLAYGITIHKSQGMTLDKLVVDCSRIFECGQVYVALSRIKSLEGLYLKSFNPQKVLNNEKVISFYEDLRMVGV